MTVLIIIAAIILVIALLLLCPIRLKLDFLEQGEISVGYLFLKFRLFPKKDKTKPSKKSKTKTEKSTQKPKSKSPKKPKPSSWRKNGVVETVSSYAELVKGLLRVFGGLLSHIVIDRLYVKVVIASGDAATTAMQYGGVCSAVYPVISLIEQKTTLKKREINIATDFDAVSLETEAEAFIKLRIKPLHIIAALISAVKCIVKFKL